ncbi:MAG: lamin tail domain-containing protein [Prevotellaceae bacterium]|jgi:Na+-transporting methylmalonyl-CoA/oxaloacetate decarboxylase gamma subunit|nr:lamin tail domain-containing protein [Prevotellaceae bacterium]
MKSLLCLPACFVAKFLQPFKFILLISLFLPLPALSQSIKDVRINEIQVHNTDGFKDEYGQANGWIELHNTGYNKVNVAGCTLEVKDKKYRIPKGNLATIIPTKGYIVFFASGTPDKGPLHTNFTLEDTDFIEFYDVDGKLVDSFQFNPVDMADGVSYGWLDDLDGKEKLMQLPVATPGNCNNTLEKEHRSELFKKQDPVGVVLTTICIVIVTITLTLLYFIFKYMGNYHIRAGMRKAKKTTAKQVGTIKVVNEKAVTNYELAAIAIALYKYSEKLHDTENMVLTLNKASKAYSPWSSKIYGLRQYPNKK